MKLCDRCLRIHYSLYFCICLKFSIIKIVKLYSLEVTWRPTLPFRIYVWMAGQNKNSQHRNISLFFFFFLSWNFIFAFSSYLCALENWLWTNSLQDADRVFMVKLQASFDVLFLSAPFLAFSILLLQWHKYALQGSQFPKVILESK